MKVVASQNVAFKKSWTNLVLIHEGLFIRDYWAGMPRDLHVVRYCLKQIMVQSSFLARKICIDELYFQRNKMHDKLNARYWTLENSMCFDNVWHKIRFSINNWDATHKKNLIGPEHINGWTIFRSSEVSNTRMWLEFPVFFFTFTYEMFNPNMTPSLRTWLRDITNEAILGRGIWRTSYRESYFEKWSLFSLELAPMHYFLRRYLKQTVHASYPPGL